MSILLERTKRTQAASTGAPVLAEKAGVITWQVVDGGKVDGWHTILGEIGSGFGASPFACASVGTLAYVAKDGEQVKQGEVVAYIKPTEAPRARPALRPAPTPKTPPAATGEATQAPESAALHDAKTEPPALLPLVQEQQAVVAPAPNGRRSTMSEPAELIAVEELAIEESAPKPARQKRERTKHATYHLSTGQIARVKRTALELALAEKVSGVSESELIRAAVELLLGLPEPALLAVLNENRSREKAEKYGTGWPRPGGKR